MPHTHRLPLIFTICCIGLSACAPTAPIPTGTPLPSETFTPTEIPPTPSPTLAPTETPTPTETPVKTIDLDINGDGVTDYVGTIKESHNIEINEGEPARFDMIRINSNTGREFGITSADTQYGYLTGYDVVTVSNGEEKEDLVYYKMKYFRKDGSSIVIEFSTLKDFIGRRGFNGEASLRQRLNINNQFPNGSDFTAYAKRVTQQVQKFTDFETQILFPENAQWINAYDLLGLLKNSEAGFVDLKFKTLVDQIR